MFTYIQKFCIFIKLNKCHESGHPMFQQVLHENQFSLVLLWAETQKGWPPQNNTDKASCIHEHYTRQHDI